MRVCAQVVEALKTLADAGHTVVAAIHQPRSRIFELFDDLILLSRGRRVYGGAASDAVGHFAELGHECPQHYNPAEFLADLISTEQSTDEAAAESEARLGELVSKAPGAAFFLCCRQAVQCCLSVRCSQWPELLALPARTHVDECKVNISLASGRA